MFAGTLERLQGAPEVQAVEGGCSGAAEVMEVVALSALRRSPGHPGGLALSPGQGRLPASLPRRGPPAGG